MSTKINKLGFSSAIFFLTQSMFLHVGLHELLNKGDISSIYSIIIGTIFSLIILYFILKIFNYKKELNLFKKNELLFGNKIGKIINIFLFIIYTLFFIYMLYSVNIYVQNKYLDATPNYIIIILFLLPVIWCVYYGFKTISKVSVLLFFITIVLILFSIINLISSIDIDNFKPFFDSKITTIIKNAFIYTSYLVTPTFSMLLIPRNDIDNSTNATKCITIFFIISSINILLLFLFIIGIFGIDLAKLYSYPEYTLMKKINYFDFIQHIENISTIQWLYSIFISSVVSLNFIKEFINYFNLKKYIYYLLIIICFITSILVFKNTVTSYNIISKYFHFIFFIPLLILLLLSNIIIKKK